MSKVRQQPLRRIKSDIDCFNKYTQEDLQALHGLQEEIKILFKNFDAKNFISNGGNPSHVKVKLIAARQHALKIQARLRDLDRLREMVLAAELEVFDSLVAAVEIKAAQAIIEFADFQNKAKQELQRLDTCSTGDAKISTDVFDNSSTTMQLSRLLETEDTEQAMHKMSHDIQNIEEMSTQLSHIVHCQGESVSSIEQNIADAHDKQLEGTKQLAWATRLKAAALPVTGALVGCTLGGPVGLFIGLKAGAAAGLLGGMVGYAGIRRYNKGKSNQPVYQPLPVTSSDIHQSSDENTKPVADR